MTQEELWKEQQRIENEYEKKRTESIRNTKYAVFFIITLLGVLLLSMSCSKVMFDRRDAETVVTKHDSGYVIYSLLDEDYILSHVNVPFHDAVNGHEYRHCDDIKLITTPGMYTVKWNNHNGKHVTKGNDQNLIIVFER